MKTIKAKPNYYAAVFEPMKKIAYEFGYNLVIHGSMDRDMDLILIPWEEVVKPTDNLIDALVAYTGGELLLHGKKQNRYSIIGGTRKSYVINLYRGHVFSDKDPQYYIDISVTPTVEQLKQLKL